MGWLSYSIQVAYTCQNRRSIRTQCFTENQTKLLCTVINVASQYKIRREHHAP